MSPVRGHLFATLATALSLPILAYLVVLALPGGCSVRVGVTVYLWTCLLPGLLFYVPAIVAVLMIVAAFVFTRLRRLIETRPILTVLIVGVIAQVAMTVAIGLTMNSSNRELFFLEAVAIPQPFVAGALSAAVYCTTLFFLRMRAR